MVSYRTVWWFVLVAGVSSCNALHSLFPIDIGLNDEETFLPRERETFDDCHMRYLTHGRDELLPQTSPPPYEEVREYNHVAAIGWTQSGGTVDWACMGALIWDNYVLTSAHCTIDERNAGPDVVRLGGGDQFPGDTSADPARYIQQRAVKHVVRHPDFSTETGRNDIALVELDKRIIVNVTVAPACLWLAPETIFEKLEILVRTKVAPGSSDQQTISSVESAQTNGCDSSASKPSELQDSQLCMQTVAPKSTECLDAPAGNPLQVRLLHNFKTSPFLVGIKAGKRTTTGGPAASCSSTSVYTRIGNYREWIVEVLKERNATITAIDLIPGVCASRFVHTRPRTDELLLERMGEIPVNVLNLRYRSETDLNYIVQIEWPTGVQGARSDCAGTFVDRSTVLTLAECVVPTPDGSKPTAVMHRKQYTNTSLPIKSITVHPGYVPGTQRNNLAVVKLQKPDQVVPACVWTWDTLPNPRVDLAGVGYSDLNTDFPEPVPNNDGSFIAYVLPAVDYYPWENCSAQLAKGGIIEPMAGLNELEHACFRNDQWAVPGVCRQVPGAPVQRYIGRSGVFLKYVYALSLSGRSCGYGIPALAILLEPHLPWLRRVIMDSGSGPSDPRSDSVIVINPDLKRSDECSNGDGTLGICVPHEMCLSTPERLRKGERVTLCSTGSVVCCPWGDIARNSGMNPVRAELDNCEERYNAIREQRFVGRETNQSNFANLPHVAEIGWPQNNGRIQFNCQGFLITTNTIVTSARCAESQLWKPTVVRIGALQAEEATGYVLQPIRRVTVHENYDETTGVNNLALVQLTAHIKPSPFYFPGCLFRNNTHLPTRQYMLDFSPSTMTIESIFPMYESDCRERFGQPITDGQMCLERSRPEATFTFSRPCFSTGDMTIWERRTEEDIYDAVYLVSLFSHGSCKELDDVQIATRISAYYDWIVDNAKQ